MVIKRITNSIKKHVKFSFSNSVSIKNEGYMCNTCKVGKVRPIQFSLKQAIVNCDNLDCDSYLEKWPWECVITRPILNSSDLCKYEKDSTCSSSDSSGVHSDLGSSGVSQYSVTDREVETLLQKSYTSEFDFEGVDKSQHTLQWQSGTTIQEQEPFVALDDKMFSTDMPSHDSENFFENKYNLFVNSFQSEEESRNINARNRHGLTSLLSDTDLGGSSSISTSQEKDTHVDNDLESWLCKLEPSELLENSIQDNCNNKWQLENGDSSYLSPSKTLIPSLNSAFSEVSPSKLNLFPFQNIKTHESLETLKGNDINTRTKESSVQNPFLSPVSSGFNEDCGDHSTSKTLSSTELSLPNYLSALEIQSSPKSSTEEKEDTIKPSEEVCSTTIETQTKPKLLSEEKKGKHSCTATNQFE
ncbi:hypothetical protein Avbf_09633 [Armadillidium vulgare]|nr:hypothetical protein Avbf_09633 [Armadillidium vulgare]